MCHNIMSGFRCFTFPWIWGFTFLFISFLFDYAPRELACGSIMLISVAVYTIKIRSSSLVCLPDLPLLFFFPQPLLPPLPLEESCARFFSFCARYTTSSEDGTTYFLFPKTFSLSANFSTRESKVISLSLTLACTDSR